LKENIWINIDLRKNLKLNIEQQGCCERNQQGIIFN